MYIYTSCNTEKCFNDKSGKKSLLLELAIDSSEASFCGHRKGSQARPPRTLHVSVYSLDKTTLQLLRV